MKSTSARKQLKRSQINDLTYTPNYNFNQKKICSSTDMFLDCGRNSDTLSLVHSADYLVKRVRDQINTIKKMNSHQIDSSNKK
jgi:hypothetical protein